MRVRLETVTNLALLTVAVLIIANISRNWVLVKRGTPVATSRNPPQVYVVGDTFEALPAVDFSATSRTAVLFFRTSCGFCSKSMPFYKRLHDALEASLDGARLVVVGSEAVGEISSYFKAQGISLDSVISTPAADPKVPGTPTLVFVDSRGTVENVWVGLLTAEQEDAVLGFVKHEA